MKTRQKRLPKQNFTIDAGAFVTSKLNIQERALLQALLSMHQERCRREYVSFTEKDICGATGISRGTFLKYRKKLIEQKYFETKKVRSGKSFTLKYRFKWAKLEKEGLIKTIKKDEAKEEKKREFYPTIKKEKKPFVNGEQITPKDIHRINPRETYNIKIKEVIRKKEERVAISSKLRGDVLVNQIKDNEKRKLKGATYVNFYFSTSIY